MAPLPQTTSMMFLESEQKQKGHHKTEKTHSLWQGETQDGIWEELLFQGWVPGVANDEGTEHCSDSSSWKDQLQTHYTLMQLIKLYNLDRILSQTDLKGQLLELIWYKIFWICYTTIYRNKSTYRIRLLQRWRLRLRWIWLQNQYLYWWRRSGVYVCWLVRWRAKPVVAAWAEMTKLRSLVECTQTHMCSWAVERKIDN